MYLCCDMHVEVRGQPIGGGVLFSTQAAVLSSAEPCPWPQGCFLIARVSKVSGGQNPGDVRDLDFQVPQKVGV